MKLIYKSIGAALNIASLLAPNWVSRQIVKIFATPKKTPLRPKEREFLATAKTIKINRNGDDIVEYHWGNTNAPLVVMSYGWAYNAGRWRHFVKDLVAAGYRCIAYDPTGHGNAADGTLDLHKNAAFIRGIIEDYGPAHTILAHSFGGTSAVYAVHDAPRYLQPQKLIIMASFSHAPSVFEAFRQELGIWKKVFNRFVKYFEKRFDQPLAYFDLALMCTEIPHIQGLIVHSPEDKVTSFRSALRYHNYWAGSFLFAPQDGGHHLGTAQITKAVLNFIIADTLPDAAEKQEKPINPKHELDKYFMGL